MEYLFHANAKINIGLRIVGKRPDGYHNLESIFQEISLRDELLIKPRESGIIIRSNIADLPRDEGNLCYQASRLLQSEAKLTTGIEIEILKNIPMGAGLGGGSSDAACCLKALNQIFGLALTDERLMELGSRIGSDIPFFINGGTALVTGRGEIIRPISFFSDYQVLIVFPGTRISTAFIYKNFEMNLTKYKPDINFEAFALSAATLDVIGSFFMNDLESVAEKYYPGIGEIKKRLISIGAKYSAMSGSGAAVFGLFSKDANLVQLKRAFEPEYQTFIANPVA